MCGSTVDIQSVIAEIRRGKKKRKKEEEITGQNYENIMSASATQGDHKRPLSQEDPGRILIGESSREGKRQCPRRCY